MSYKFPIASKLLHFAGRARRNWLSRHQNSFNFWIHLIGIPLALAALPLLFILPWYVGCSAIGLGYILQWIGHRVEGNDVGEFIPFKRMFGLPVVAVAPQFLGQTAEEEGVGLDRHAAKSQGKE
jgi:hypothetical protein